MAGIHETECPRGRSRMLRVLVICIAFSFESLAECQSVYALDKTPRG